MLKLYTAPSSEPGYTTLQADVRTWKELLALRPVPRGGSISDQAAKGEAMSQAAWRDTSGSIEHAITSRGDDEVVRVRFAAENAAAVVEMARW